VLLYGGDFRTGYFDDTWGYDGVAWTRLQPTANPGRRGSHAMTTDVLRNRVVVFGGGTSSTGSQNDTWEWDGSNWLATAPANRPSRRYDLSLAFDVARGRVVLFGGFTGNVNGETWTWDGAVWTQRSPPTAPPARSGHVLAWDPGSGQVLAFGGFSGFSPSLAAHDLADTWSFDGVTWSERTSRALAPGRRDGHGLAYDLARQQLVLFGGSILTAARDDTLLWNGAEWRLVPLACHQFRCRHCR
jgi:hypothetical protein